MTPKRYRKRLARAELLMHLAVAVERWGQSVIDQDGGRPFAEWPADDPLRLLVSTYDLSPADLASICHELGDRLERQAERSGYENHWDPE
jgi:hypothetical protein